MRRYLTIATAILLCASTAWGGIGYGRVIGGGISAAAAVTYKFNFQPDASAVPAGFTKDSGAAYTAGRGWSYYGGSLTANTDGRDRDANAAQEYDTFILTSSNKQWDYDVSNGSYSVKVVTGDPSFSTSGQYVQVEGTTFQDNVSTTANNFSEITHTVTVSDGKLTMTFIGTTGDVRLCFIEITSM